MTEHKAESSDQALAIAVPGDILSTTAPLLRQQISEALRRSPAKQMEIDLRAANMVDSVGLNLLVWVWKTMKERQGSLRVRISSQDVDRTLRFTRLSNYIEVIREAR